MLCCKDTSDIMGIDITNLSESEIAPILETANQSEVERLIPLIAYLAVISVTGIIGNGLVCYVYHPLRNTSSSRWFKYFLGVMDLFLCAIVVPIEIATTFQQLNFSNLTLCQVTAFMNLWTYNSLGYIFVIVAIDRYRKVCTPYGWQINTIRAKTICGVLLVGAGALAIPIVDVYKIYKVKLPNFDILGSECSFRKEEKGLSLKVLYIGFGMFMFVGSLVAICVMYCCIGVVITKHTIKTRTNHYHNSTLPGNPSHQSTTDVDDTPASTVAVEAEAHDNSFTDNNAKAATTDTSNYRHSTSRNMRIKRAHKATFSMCLISVGFVICYLPFLSLILVRNLISDFHENMSDEWRAVYKFFLRSGFLSSAINPFIYGCSDSKFRRSCSDVGRALRLWFGSCKPRDNGTK